MDHQSSPYLSSDLNPDGERLSHMINYQQLIPQLSTLDTTETDQHYPQRGDFLQINPQSVSFAGHDIEMPIQDFDMSSFSLDNLDNAYAPPKDSNTNDYLAQLYAQPLGSQNGTVPSHFQFTFPTATPPSEYLQPRTFNQEAYNVTPMPQGPAISNFQWESISNPQSALSNGLAPCPLMESEKHSTMGTKKNPRPRSFRRRRYQPRRSPHLMRPRPSVSVSTKNISSVPLRTPATLSLDNNMPRSVVGVDGAKDDTVDPQRALNILRKSIETQPYSSISQREMADLIKKIEDVVLREKLYGSSSSDNGEVTIPSTMSDSISNSEIIDLEDSTDATSVSSTPQLTVEEIPNVEPAEAQTVHKQNCLHCGNRPNYYCSKSDCGYFAHTRGDAKRHEEGEKHYPQARFMCCECPLSQADLNKNGRLVCEFCEVVCTDFRLLRAHYLRCSHAKDRGKTFGRKDHFIQHLREEHGIPNDTLLVARSRYPIASNWPKQCSRCSKTFQTWEERMSHLAKHAEEDFHPRGFDKKPKDDDDDDDNKDDYHGGGRFHGKRAGRRFDTAPSMQHKQASSSGNNNRSSHGNYRGRTETVLSDISNQEGPSRKPSLTLERYLNDTESPIPIPLRYQKCEGQEPSCHESSGTSARAHQRVSAIKTGPAQQQLKTPASLQLKPGPNYPIPIPSNKQNKALKLYINYKREVELELNTTPTANDSFSSITTESTLSKHCKTTTPISTSTYDGATNVYSVVSFDDSQSSLSTKDQPREFSFSGRNNKKRTRRLNPGARAKAALIRCLGPCSVCRSRRLPCPLSHHDIGGLEALASSSSLSVSSQSLSRLSGVAHSDLSAPIINFIYQPPENLFIDTCSNMNFISSDLVESLGLPIARNRVELTEELAPVTGAKADVGEWLGLDNGLNWLNIKRGSGKSHLMRYVVNGPWSSKEPNPEILSSWVQSSHFFNKDPDDLIPDRISFQRIRGDDSVSLEFMDNSHVHLKNTDNRAPDSERVFASHLKFDMKYIEAGGPKTYFKIIFWARIHILDLCGGKPQAFSKDIQSVIESIKAFGNVTDVLGTNYSPIIFLLLENIRVALHIAQEHNHYFEKLIGILFGIGEMLPSLRDYEMLLPNHGVLHRRHDSYQDKNRGQYAAAIEDASGVTKQPPYRPDGIYDQRLDKFGRAIARSSSGGTEPYNMPCLISSRKRFLTFLLNKRTERIRCHLTHDIQLLYKAISHAWSGANNIPPAISEGTILQRLARLYFALRHLRGKEESQTVWIDSICLNQQPVLKQNREVQRMKLVYENAQRVAERPYSATEDNIIWRPMLTGTTTAIEALPISLDEQYEAYLKTYRVINIALSYVFERHLKSDRKLSRHYYIAARRWGARPTNDTRLSSAIRIVLSCSTNYMVIEEWTQLPGLIFIQAHEFLNQLQISRLVDPRSSTKLREWLWYSQSSDRD